ncbi:MAG: glycosyltransferase family 9 protein [Desulfovibrio sp.]|jgi:heptosyltransferase-2|nr:glycosyltransferase family 9 protein [Desulfovibrio sp.]
MTPVTDILIVKLGAIGDVAQASAMLPVIRSLYPEASVTWMAGRSAAEVLRCLDADMEIFPVDDRKILTGSRWEKLAEILRIARHFRLRRFSLALIPYFSRRYLALCLGIRAKTVRAFWQKRTAIPGRHRSVNHIRLLTTLDGNDFPPGGTGESSRVFADAVRFPPLRPLPFSGDAPDILLVPGGARNLLADDGIRRWPLARYVTLAGMLLEKGYSVGILGGPDDTWARKAFARLPVRDYIGTLNIGESMALLARVALLVTHDTGPLHMMGLAGGKMVALFGPTLPAEVAPPGAVCLQAQGFFPCRPCYDGKRFAADCKRAICMEGIAPQAVFEAVQRALAVFP